MAFESASLWSVKKMVYWRRYCSEQYLRQYTIFFTLHKDALSKAMRKDLNL